MMFLLTTNASTDAFTDHNGIVAIQFNGTFDSGTMTVQVKVPDASDTWQAMEDGAYTSGPVSRTAYVGSRVPVRITLSGAGASASIAGTITRIGA